MRATWFTGAVFLAAIIVSVSGCDEEKKPAPAKPAPSAAPAAPAPSLSPPPKEEPKPAARPKKTAADCPKTTTVTFPNADFEAAVRLKAQKKDGNVTFADLAKVRSLNVSQSKLSELDVCLFSHLKELRELFIGPGEVDDLSPIAGLTKLESLRLSLNPIRDLAPLAGMTKLDRVDLAHTQVRDLTPLQSMTNLSELLLDDTPVEDVAPVGFARKAQRARAEEHTGERRASA